MGSHSCSLVRRTPQLIMWRSVLWAGIITGALSNPHDFKNHKRDTGGYRAPASTPSYGAPQKEQTCTLQKVEGGGGGYGCEEKCSTSYGQECNTQYENKCETSYENKCETTYEDQCKTEYEQQCSTKYETECQTRYENKYEQQCETKYDEK